MSLVLIFMGLGAIAVTFHILSVMAGFRFCQQTASILAKGSLIILKNYLRIFVVHFGIFTLDRSWEFPSKKGQSQLSPENLLQFTELACKWEGSEAAASCCCRIPNSSLQDTPRSLKPSVKNIVLKVCSSHPQYSRLSALNNSLL